MSILTNLGKNASYLGTNASDRKMDIKFVFSDPKTPRKVFSVKRIFFGVAPLFVGMPGAQYIRKNLFCSSCTRRSRKI